MKATSFEEACKDRGYDPATILPDVSNFPAKHQKALLATAKMFVIAESLNEGHEFNWNDWNERKWTPWFDMEVDDNNPSGFRFNVSYCAFVTTRSTGGSRLCYRTRELSDYAGTQFLELYRDMMIIPKYTYR